MFLTSREEFKDYLNKNKKPFMANFYKSNRTKLNVLVDNDYCNAVMPNAKCAKI